MKLRKESMAIKGQKKIAKHLNNSSVQFGKQENVMTRLLQLSMLFKQTNMNAWEDPEFSGSRDKPTYENYLYLQRRTRQQPNPQVSQYHTQHKHILI